MSSGALLTYEDLRGVPDGCRHYELLDGALSRHAGAGRPAPSRRRCAAPTAPVGTAGGDNGPPCSPGYLGWDPDPVLDGWDAYESVFDLLERDRVIA